MRASGRNWMLGPLILLGAGAGTLFADTLLLRSGKRLSGHLVSVRGNSVEFEEEKLFGGSRRHRLHRSDVQRIELSGSYDRDDDRDVADSGGPPSGMREREVRVAASTRWIETGLSVRSGQTVYFNAQGKVSWGPGREDDAGGESGSPRNAQRPLPNRPAAALIGRIGNDAPFFIGNEQGAIRMRSSGPLFLGLNDDYLPDNSGELRVTVFY